jgi:hypothetical protein
MAQGYPADIEFSVAFKVGQCSRETVRGDGDGGRSNLIIDRLERVEEVEVGVEIRQQFTGWEPGQEMPH